MTCTLCGRENHHTAVNCPWRVPVGNRADLSNTEAVIVALLLALSAIVAVFTVIGVVYFFMGG